MRVVAALIAAMVLAAFMLVARGFSQTTVDIVAAQEQLKLEVAFDKHWVSYLLAEAGCPVPPPNVVLVLTRENCNKPTQLRLDERKAARELAKKVFGLDEPIRSR